MGTGQSSVIDRYFQVWAFLIPVTSVLLVPTVQGTLPSTLMALACFGLIPALRPAAFSRFLTRGLAFWVVFIALGAAAQMTAVLTGPQDISGLPLLEPFDADGSVLLRRSLFTQALYLLAGTTTFTFLWTFYRRQWDRYILFGAVALGVYGIYEVVFFFLFEQSGDFLSNRVFVAGDEVHTGSFFQTLTVAGVRFQRLKSLTGEPSMYAFTTLPYWIYALHTGRVWMSAFLFATLLMTASTTALLGISVYAVVRLYYARRLSLLNRYVVGFAMTLAFAAVAAWPFLQPLLELLVLDKLSFSSGSAITRLRLLMTNIEFFRNAPVPVQLFGIGFGYTRSTDMASTLLVNTGLVGFALATLLLLYPVLRLGNSRREIGLKALLLVVYVVMMLAVAEYSYLTLWLFLGIAYKEVVETRRLGRNGASSGGERPIHATVDDGSAAVCA